MKVVGWLHIEDGGDGSAIPRFFGTKKEAQEAADNELEEFGQALCDNVMKFEIEVDKSGCVTKDLGIDYYD